MEAASFALVFSLPVLFAPLLFPSSPPEGWDEEEEEDEAVMMVERRGAALWSLVAGDVVAMCWRLHRPELDEVAARPSP